MLEQVGEIFDNMPEMLKKLKKPSYEKNMIEFRKKYSHYITEMLEYTEQSLQPSDGAKEAAAAFGTAVEKNFTGKKKLNSGRKADISFFMIYYVFPAILLRESEQSRLLCESLCNDWNARFKTNIGFSDYDSLYNSFRDKVFGIF